MPLCGFYAAAIARVLQLFALAAECRACNECRAAGARQGLPPSRAGRAARAPASRLRPHDQHRPRTLLVRRWPRAACAGSRGRAGPAARRAPPSRASSSSRSRTRGTRAAAALAGRSVAVLLADESARGRLGAITRAERVRAFEQLHLPPSRLAEPRDGHQGRPARRRRRGHRRRRIASTATTLTVDGSAASGSTSGALEPRSRSGASSRSSFAHLRARSPAASRRGGTAPTGPRAARPRSTPSRTTSRGCSPSSPVARPSFLEAALQTRRRTTGRGWRCGRSGPSRATTLAALAAARAVRADVAARRAARVSRRRLADRAEALRRGVRRADGRCRNRRPPHRPRSRPCSTTSASSSFAAGRRRRPGTPAYYLTKAADADPDDPDYLFNLGYAYALDRNRQGAIYWLREALRRDPADGDAHYVLAVGAARHRAARSRRRASASWPRSCRRDTKSSSARAADEPDRGAARARARARWTSTARCGRSAPIRRSSTRRSASSASWRTFHLERGRRLFEREQDREAMAELRRAVYLSPYEAQAHLLIGRIHLRGGRPRDAVDALQDLDLERGHRRRRTSRWPRRT